MAGNLSGGASPDYIGGVAKATMAPRGIQFDQFRNIIIIWLACGLQEGCILVDRDPPNSQN